MATPMVIYNDTVAIYQFTDEKRVGVEIVNEGFARTMKSIFELYWKNSQLAAFDLDDLPCLVHNGYQEVV